MQFIHGRFEFYIGIAFVSIQFALIFKFEVMSVSYLMILTTFLFQHYSNSSITVWPIVFKLRILDLLQQYLSEFIIIFFDMVWEIFDALLQFCVTLIFVKVLLTISKVLFFTMNNKFQHSKNVKLQLNRTIQGYLFEHEQKKRKITKSFDLT